MEEVEREREMAAEVAALARRVGELESALAWQGRRHNVTVNALAGAAMIIAMSCALYAVTEPGAPGWPLATIAAGCALFVVAYLAGLATSRAAETRRKQI